MQLRPALVAAIVSPMITGCATMSGISHGTDMPPIDEFPKRELSFRSRGTQTSVRESLVSELSRRGMLHSTEIRAPNTYVITTYAPEPREAGAKRLQKTAFRFSVGQPAVGETCVPLGVTWLTKSRGVREEAWSVQPDDLTSRPAAWPAIQTQITANAC